MDEAANHFDKSAERPSWRLPEACNSLIQQLFVASRADRWNLSLARFTAVLTHSAAKRFGESLATSDELKEYFTTLHIRDLALACACVEGAESAWNDFVAEYRGYLRGAAAAILRRPASEPAAVELADSLFAELYGISGATAGGRSLFRYFHGRSSLKTWLRAVLAQRHVDSLRATKKFDSLDDCQQHGEIRRVSEIGKVALPFDPHREAYLQRFREALRLALNALKPRDRTRLRLYYAEDRTLALIGTQLGEHESSVSRNLERIRKELRATVEGLLRTGKTAANGGPASPGMSSIAGLDDAQIQLCIQYAAEDAGIDLDNLFASRKQKPGPDRILEP